MFGPTASAALTAPDAGTSVPVRSLVHTARMEARRFGARILGRARSFGARTLGLLRIEFGS